MLTDLVVVRNDTIDDRSVSVIIKAFKYEVSGDSEERVISRSYVFKNHVAYIPFDNAKMLIAQRKELGTFIIEGPVNNNTTLMSTTEKLRYNALVKGIAEYNGVKTVQTSGVEQAVETTKTEEITDTPSEYKCEVCGKVVKNNTALKSHKKYIHNQ